MANPCRRVVERARESLTVSLWELLCLPDADNTDQCIAHQDASS